MLNFCTLFDSNYLSRGLAMHESLMKYTNNFTLFVFAFDDRCLEILNKLQLKNVKVISLEEFENEALLSAKKNRTIGEYCWTCTSSTILYVLEKYQLDHCTYIEADLYFYSDPKVLFDEMGTDSVLITEHRFSPKYIKFIANGKYCVQYMTFKNNEKGVTVLKWWVNACIEWCYNKHENGKFGDQKYLDDWTIRFEGVHELQNIGGGVAPWNIQQYDIWDKNNRYYGKVKKTGAKFDFIFYHFHGLRFWDNNRIDLCEYQLLPVHKELIYKPYLRHLDEVKNRLLKIDNTIIVNENYSHRNNLRTFYRKARRIIENRYNIFDKNKFMNRIWQN